MSSKGSGHVIMSGASAHYYADIGAVLTIASMQANGAEFWWSVTPDHDVLNAISGSNGIDVVEWSMHVVGYNPEKFSWASAPVTVSGLDARYWTGSIDANGNARLEIHDGAPTGRYDFTLHIVVNGTDVDLDPEVDIGMEENE